MLQVTDWLDEIEAQADETSPYYLPRLIAEIRRLRQQAAALVAALASEGARAEPPAPPDGWQPIETAPKDGTRILAWNGYQTEVVDWGERSVWSDRRTNKGMTWCVGDCDGEFNRRDTFEPTFWQPLPEPPASAGGAAQP